MKSKDPTIHISNQADLKLANLKLLAQSKGNRISKERIIDWIISESSNNIRDFDKSFLEWARKQKSV